MNERRDGVEIDLQKLLLAYLHKWWLILATAIVVGVAALIVTINFITPMYKAEVTVYVNNARGDQQVDYISSSNLATAQRLVNTYINIIESDTVLEKVAAASGLDITAADIRKSMSAEQLDETEVFTVTITHPDPVQAAQIANALAEVAPNEIANIVEGSSTKIIDYAKVPENPSSPNATKNTILGVLVGGVVAVLYVTLRFMLDVRIKDEEDLNMLFDVPVLAQIPSFTAEGSKRRGYGYDTAAAEKGGEAK